MLTLEVGAGSSTGMHGQVDLAVHVVQHGLHHGLAAGEEQVLGVGAPGPGRITHPAARATRTPPTSTWSVSGDTESPRRDPTTARWAGQ